MFLKEIIEIDSEITFKLTVLDSLVVSNNSFDNQEIKVAHMSTNNLKHAFEQLTRLKICHKRLFNLASKL